MMSLLVLGPVRVYRESFAAALDQEDGVGTVSVAASAQEASHCMRAHSTDVVLADASTDAGLRAVCALSRSEPSARVLVITATDDDATVMECARAGISGFVAADGTLSEILDAARVIARGEIACSPAATAVLLRWVVASETTPARRGSMIGLTTRERQILALIDEGMSNKEIAARLYIEVSTVKNHVHNVLEKLGARRRSEAVARARAARIGP
ncbi:hypothetical protein Pa4123_63270 [Phytohabitans aurantiacus]|uniref:DNA-binding response regulator n=2 Tax=Phytohabitans aurantiacus TaxID=3016789 RepID=A0ABQ5R2V4_9ACTN|nr:hypothetical protein Pa4123_63270 [Phytohabitans aurantiacus]